MVGERKNPALLLLTSGDAALRLRAAGRMALRGSMLWIDSGKQGKSRGRGGAPRDRSSDSRGPGSNSTKSDKDAKGPRKT